MLLITFFQMVVKVIPVLLLLHHRHGSRDLVMAAASLIWIIQISIQFLFDVPPVFNAVLDTFFFAGLQIFLILLFADGLFTILFTSLSAWMFSSVLTAICGFLAASVQGYLPLGVEAAAVLFFLGILTLYVFLLRLYAPALQQMFEIWPPRTIRLLCIYPLLAIIAFWAGFSGDTILFETGSNALFNLLFMSMTLVVYVLLLKSLMDLTQRKEVESELECARNVVAQQRNQYNQQLQNYESIQRLHHDFLLHTRALQGMDTKAEVDKYLAKLANEYQLYPARQFAAHRSVNAIVAWYAQQCQNQGITLETELDIPPDIRLDALDLCVVIGNLMQNALEANQRLPLQQERFIRFHAKMVQDRLMLIMENTFDGEIIKKDGAIVSRKKKGGLGLLGIHRIVNQPGNDIDVHYSDRIFTVMITLSPTDA